jgi:outer membrane immunogenic protein
LIALWVTAGQASSSTNYDLFAPIVAFQTADRYRLARTFFGGQFGANYQIGKAVIGMEADWNRAGFEDGHTTVTPAGVTNQVDSRLRDMVTLRGRIGHAFDRVLVYATGGWAQLNLRNSLTVIGPAGTPSSTHDFARSKAWVAGAGVEWALFDRASIRVEYLHIEARNSAAISDPGNPPVVPRTANFSNGSIDMIRLGANVKLNWWN